jgi:hypothetical protein
VDSGAWGRRKVELEVQVGLFEEKDSEGVPDKRHSQSEGLEQTVMSGGGAAGEGAGPGHRAGFSLRAQEATDGLN